MGVLVGFILIFAAVVIGLKMFSTHYFAKDKTSNILHTLFTHFKARSEQLLEFRVSVEKGRIKNREFEVKTIHHKYYRVTIRNLEVIGTENIDRFTVDEEDCLIRGIVDPENLDNFELIMNDL